MNIFPITSLHNEPSIDHGSKAVSLQPKSNNKNISIIMNMLKFSVQGVVKMMLDDWSSFLCPRFDLKPGHVHTVKQVGTNHFYPGACRTKSNQFHFMQRCRGNNLVRVTRFRHMKQRWNLTLQHVPATCRPVSPNLRQHCGLGKKSSQLIIWS